jgi:hypothetical protein
MLGTFTKTIGPRASPDIYPLYMSMLSVGGNQSSWVSFENKMEENTKVSNKQMCKFYKLTDDYKYIFFFILRHETKKIPLKQTNYNFVIEIYRRGD